MSGLEEVSNSLERFPERGAVPAPLADLRINTFRQLPISPYRIVYEVIGRQVFVILIVHIMRDFPSLLQERLLRA